MAATANLANSALELNGLSKGSYIHPSCVIDPSVCLGKGVKIYANVVIERGVRIGHGTVIHAGCYVGDDCAIGNHTILYQSVTLREKTQIGNRVTIEAGVVIGSDGFGYAKEKNGANCKIPQVGYVIIEDEVRIGSNSTIDRATLGRTIVGRGATIGNLVQVGHNVTIGEETTIGDSVGICGSCKIGAAVAIGRGVGMVGHIRIGDHAEVDNGSGVSKDVSDGAKITGSPAMDESQYLFYQTYVAKLPELVARLTALERNCGSPTESS